VQLIARGLNGRYLIQRVTTTIGVGGYVSAQVELGAVDQSLVGLLMNLKRASGPALEWNENEIEVLDEVLDTSEALSVSDSDVTITALNGPYQWDTTAKWNYGAYAG
jgi:hypothetical protein